MAFSCAPTSSSCILVRVSSLSLENIDILTCCPNAKEWNRFVFKNQLPQNCKYFIRQIVFSNGVFYCLVNNGCLTSFDPSSNSWNILSLRSLEEPRGIKNRYMTEHQGKIFLIYTYFYIMNPTVFKLDPTSWEWVEKKTFGGLTIYTSDLFSEIRVEKKDQSGMKNCLCFTDYNKVEWTCICTYYNLDEKRVICVKSIELGSYQHIWIIPPLNLPLFDQLLL